MLIVAVNNSTVVIDKGDTWEIYDPAEERIIETIAKEQYPQHLNALCAKWGI